MVHTTRYFCNGYEMFLKGLGNLHCAVHNFFASCRVRKLSFSFFLIFFFVSKDETDFQGQEVFSGAPFQISLFEFRFAHFIAWLNYFLMNSANGARLCKLFNTSEVKMSYDICPWFFSCLKLLSRLFGNLCELKCV